MNLNSYITTAPELNCVGQPYDMRDAALFEARPGQARPRATVRMPRGAEMSVIDLQEKLPL